MARLTKAELTEVMGMKPIARDVSQYVWNVEVITINHFECDEIIVSFDESIPEKFRLQYDSERDSTFFTAKNRRWYLDEIVRYNSPWMGGRV